MSVEELKRRDPEGYYVVTVKRGELSRLGRLVQGVRIEEAGELVIIRTKSRSLAKLILRKLGRLI
ncbi:MAG: hypothetical protein DRJ96_03205 [Thermoprotei archaeon]|nr:MAG: hypothetical protein DRJ67_01170 [Thermoprotei archaeon]RLE97678.1 MAG: hypothetical protein DRJ96_03205 [Thermoprotei archaeon]